MTKIHVLSDVHNEFGVLEYNPPECDVVICAGDIQPGVDGIVWAKETYKNTPVIYVAGNHEWYGKRILHSHYKAMKQKADELGIHFLQNEVVIINDVRFIGCTLWTDFNLYGNQPLSMLQAYRTMNDYEEIYYDDNRGLQPYMILEEFVKSFDFLQCELAKSFYGKTVVVTHHAPSEQSCPAWYKGDTSNAFYASRLDQFIEENEPSLWIHGHMHYIADYMIGCTRVIVNPRGYASINEQTGFNDQLIIEI